jgi:hypothetical protein
VFKALTFFVLVISQIAFAQNSCLKLFDSYRDVPMWPPLETMQILKFELTSENFIEINSFPQRPYGGGPHEEVEGVHFERLFTMPYQGHRVFGKVSRIRNDGINTGNRTLENFTNEVAWAQRLALLEIGPKFFGFSNTAEGNYVILTEFIEGTHLSLTPSMDVYLPLRFKFRPGLIESLRHIQQVVREQGIILKDLDLRITEDRAYVIDPEEFLVAGTYDEVEGSVQLIEKFIQQLLKRK